ncbi:hypothetical protein GCM10010094_05840 [Streptomyces flaveus]|uniref:Uncharacterized protein n=1 Tax=Streptomyces flaveus TaxID=66370 RepID=A0A917V7B0_9ACTN|nr:hypothetical protein GCM10010094_05840 [Streptomyces flaveus]
MGELTCGVTDSGVVRPRRPYPSHTKGLRPWTPLGAAPPDPRIGLNGLVLKRRAG